eukprot:TRINITY_DN18729_c0_g1_i1.p1 TRINITY_DN18729_c0_g1~~TRINITY_DN18729_c0_g1_i1.p1  ORF type:complete len:376 (+),score=105.30 TRINITY_DN18729_c0_g1_i1:50-1129(+)
MGKLKPTKVGKKKPEKGRFEACIKGAEEAMSKFEYEKACEWYEKALGIRPKDTEVLDSLGEVLVSYLGDAEKGEAVLRKSIEIAPDEGHSKYMTVGQLVGGGEGLLLFKKGAENLLKVLNEATDPTEKEELSDAMAQSFCAVAELWTTDLCMEEGAEHQCKAALDYAALHSPNNIEVHYLYAQLHLRLNNIPGCKESLMKTLKLLEVLPESRHPPTDVKIEIGKLLMQVGEWEEAYQLLKSLLVEDDHNGYLWYLMGETLKSMGKLRRSHRHLHRARGIAARLAASEPNNTDDDGPAATLAKIDELLKEVASKLPPDQQQKDDDGWVTDSDDEDERTVAKEAEEQLRRVLPKQGDTEMA